MSPALQEPVEAALRQPLQLMRLGLNLRGGDGLQLAQRLKGIRPGLQTS